MKLNEVVDKVYNKNWTRINNFSVDFMILNSDFSNSIGWDIDNDDLNLALKSIDTPQYTNNPIEIFTGNEWRFNNGRDEMFRFTMTFRDYDQFKLYRSFVKMYNISKDNYFDKIKLQIDIYADDEMKVNRKLVLSMNDAIIENISQMQFDHTTENQIAEFSVGFKCSSPVHLGEGNSNVSSTDIINQFSTIIGKVSDYLGF